MRYRTAESETKNVNQKTLADYNPFDPETLSCPYDFNQQLREQAPVYQCPKTGVFFISTYDLVVEVVKKEKAFSNKFAMIQAGGGEIQFCAQADEIEQELAEMQAGKNQV